MGWFNKKDKEEEKSGFNKDYPSQLPKLPELPELPELKENREEAPHKLPSIPNSSFGKKFSQESIKDAISGKSGYNFNPQEKTRGRIFEADEFNYKNIQRIPNPPMQTKKEFPFPKTEEIESEDFDFEIEPTRPKMKLSAEPIFDTTSDTSDFQPETTMPFKKEPVFIRIDKFQEAMRTFEKTKKELTEIEKALRDITAVREDEDKELALWQSDVIKIKDQIEKVDSDIFSGIE